MITGSQGGPTVVYTLPSALVLMPKPKVGHCKSAIVNGSAMACKILIIKIGVCICRPDRVIRWDIGR